MLLPWVFAIPLDKWTVADHPFICPVCGEPYKRVEAAEDAFVFYLHRDLPSGEPAICSVEVEKGVTNRGTCVTHRLDGTPFTPLRGE
jgi:hypothetical protein